MDYKYIEQLVERYFACETTLAEEEILKAFFSQEDVPANLHKYKVLFTYEQNDKKETVLGEDFDSKILSIIDEPIPVKARTITIRRRLMPLFRAAAIVAIILTIQRMLCGHRNSVFYDTCDSEICCRQICVHHAEGKWRNAYVTRPALR